MEVLGEGIAIEQMQELRGDQAFMTDLQGRLELKGSDLTAEQFLNEVEYNLDKRPKLGINLYETRQNRKHFNIKSTL